MAKLEKIGAFALTEPDHGSDSVALEATARREGNEWVINGRKRWPGNAVWCDYIVVYARDVADKQVKAFVVEKDNPDYKATKIEGKLSLRMVQNADITLTDCVCRTATRLRTAPGCSWAPAIRWLGHRSEMPLQPTASLSPTRSAGSSSAGRSPSPRWCSQCSSTCWAMSPRCSSIASDLVD